MQQQVSVITLGTPDLRRSRHFYVAGFGWCPIFENEEIIFYQMNGFVFGTWLKSSLEADLQRASGVGPDCFALAHNVSTEAEVRGAIKQLLLAGGHLLREADYPPQGGLRGYVADPDGHAWEIAWNPTWTTDEQGLVHFGL